MTNRADGRVVITKDLLPVLIASFLALTVFLVDTFSSTESAVAVLYVLAQLMLSLTIRRRGMVRAAGLFALLACVSFLVTHENSHGLSTILRLFVSLLAICVTGIILYSSQSAQKQLILSRDQARSNENRYRSLFEGSGVPLWEQDFYRLREFVLSLRCADGERVALALAKARATPDQAMELITTTSVNTAALAFLKSANIEEAVTAIDQIYRGGDFPIEAMLQALFDGARRFEGRCTISVGLSSAVSVNIIVTFPEEDTGHHYRVVVALMELTTEITLHPHLRAMQAENSRSTRISTVGVFSASMGHEIAQPLGALLLNAQTCVRWLLKQPPELDNALGAAERVVTDAERLNGIAIRARSFLNSAPIKLERIDLAKAVEDVRAALSAKIRECNMIIEVTGSRDLPLVITNRQEIQHILTDVFSIYLKPVGQFTEQTVLTVVVSESRSGYIKLALEAKSQSTMTNASCSSCGDTALAFALTRATVEALGGTLLVKNSHRSEVLTIELPAAIEDRPAQTLLSPSPTPPSF